ncbi:hypothetical protein ACHHYP_20004, partial [Achlya hypogyna]
MLCWPIQGLTYATLIYVVGFMLLTAAAWVLVVPMVGLAIVLVPYSVLHRICCLLLQTGVRSGYPWAVVYACTQPLLLADVWWHNIFAPTSKRIDLHHDMSQRHNLTPSCRPCFVVRVQDVASPLAVVKAWTYLVAVRGVVCTFIYCVWIDIVWDTVISVIEWIAQALDGNIENLQFFFFWGTPLRCADHPVGFFG